VIGRLVLLGALGAAAPQDAALRDALDALYDGATETALRRLDQLQAEHPDDPLAAYAAALALAWKVEQRPAATDLDAVLERQAEHAIALADARLARDAGDARARLARGAAWGVRSRRALFRGERRQAAQTALRMREELVRVVEQDGPEPDASFGLGLYDYYADVLPRLLKLLRFVAGMPGGDRARGLAAVEQARRAARLHDVEAEAQLHEICAVYERRHDRALEAARHLRERYPGSPLWGLKLAAHLRDRLGLYVESVATYRELEAASLAGHVNYAPVVAAMARAGAGEALLLDLRLLEARAPLRLAADGDPAAPWIAPRAAYLLGRALELSGEREAALGHYRRAAAAPEPEIRSRAERALRRPLGADECRAARLLGEARRLYEAGHTLDAAQVYRAVLALTSRSEEALLRVAEDDLHAGRLAAARRALARLARAADPQPPWVRPWCRVLLAEAYERAGQRPRALLEYKRVWDEPGGLAELRARAGRGLRSAAPPASAAPAPPEY
jgi:tetratricopeptide (TPR) repeat protein